jgi:colicin import membrane protein
MGKELISGWKEQAKKVDAERAHVCDRLEALQKEIRAPLTEWENAEKERIAKHEADIAEIVNAGRFTLENWQPLPPEAMADRLKEIEGLLAWTWQEFAARAKLAIDDATAAIRTAIEKRQAYDAQQAELERLRREEAERKQREHEEKIAREAADKARRDAELEAKRKADEEAARVKAEQQRAEKVRQRLQREKEEADARARKAEEDRKAGEEKPERDRIAAAEKAKRDAELAAQRERAKIEAESKAEADALAKREADKKHRAKIEHEVFKKLVFLGLDNEEANRVVHHIAKGEVPNVSINY